jgi:hypothetical protein
MSTGIRLIGQTVDRRLLRGICTRSRSGNFFKTLVIRTLKSFFFYVFVTQMRGKFLECGFFHTDSSTAYACSGPLNFQQRKEMAPRKNCVF